MVTKPLDLKDPSKHHPEHRFTGMTPHTNRNKAPRVYIKKCKKLEVIARLTSMLKVCQASTCKKAKKRYIESKKEKPQIAKQPIEAGQQHHLKIREKLGETPKRQRDNMQTIKTLQKKRATTLYLKDSRVQRCLNSKISTSAKCKKH
ncbi:hypothetical protein KCU90_g130, partial [Aureobasidium melanogenum]